MDVQLKTLEEIDKIRAAGKIVDEVLTTVSDAAQVGVTTRELDTLAREIIDGRARPAFLDYPNSNVNKPNFPGVLCTSVNAEVVHGVPNDRPLEEGDVLSVHFGVLLQEELDHRHRSEVRRDVQRAVPGQGLSVDIGSFGDENLGDVDSVVLGAQVNGREAVFGLGVDISAVG